MKKSKSSKKIVKNIYKYSGKKVKTDEEVRKRDGYTAPLPKRNKSGYLKFKDAPDFTPNMTPKEVLQNGSFGGTYFRPIYSSVTELNYDKMWNELPTNWLEGLNIKKMIASPNYDKKVNTYKVKCGGDLFMWESSGWIVEQDPYGWFMWYCRFYLGRRSDDDKRQISRWNKFAGFKGRFRNSLINRCDRKGKKFDDPSVSPAIRQSLQHWGYKLTKKDSDSFLESKK